ncbi:MAG: hypothetical protein FWH23_03455 [Bacteroidales bacterium]|nr:hypothetical protein [Bacteroidales bacterium]MCL2132736.1 hypothetical protein [Bacteroidales bacterium]
METSLGNSNLNVSEIVKMYLKKSAKYANVVAIIGYVFCGLTFLLGLLVLAVQASVPNGLTVGLVYIIMALIMLFPANYLYKFANKIRNALLSDNQQEFEGGLLNLQSLFCFHFRLFIVCICLITISILVIIIAGPPSTSFNPYDFGY